MKRGFVDTSDGQIHYVTDGAGEPLVCLHSIPSSSWDFHKVMPLLAKKYRVIAIDIAGYGESDTPPKGYKMADYAKSVGDFLDGLDIKKASLVGWAAGAALVGEFASSYPKRVNKLVLAGYPLYTKEMLENGITAIANIFGVDPLELQRDGSHMLNVNRYSWAQLGFRPALEDLYGLTVAVLQAGARDEKAHLAWSRYCEQGTANTRLPLVKCPTLILTSAQEMFHSTAETVSKLVPGSKVAIIGIDATSGYLPIAAPEEFAKSIAGFLE